MVAERPLMPPRRRLLPRAVRARRSLRGFGLIEVLMALLLFSIGVLGMVAMQARASQFSTQAEDRGRAALLANDLIATMWTRGTTSLDNATLSAWQDRVADPSVDGLPDGEGEVSDPDADGVVTITISWRAPGRAATEADNRYLTKVVMP